jgi:hypothetical protein
MSLTGWRRHRACLCLALAAAALALVLGAATEAAQDPPPDIDVDCTAARRDGQPIAEAQRRAVHYYVVSGLLYVGLYEKPLDSRSKETVVNRGWPIGMSNDEAIGASGFQMLLGISVNADLVVIYRRRSEFRHVVLQDSRSGGGTRVIVETGPCRPHGGP